MKKYSLVLLILLITVSSNAQNVGIGTTTPIARLHVADSNVVFTGPLVLPGSPGNPPLSGAGTRMMWYPQKAAFRTGFVDGVQWDKDSIGNYSFAAGYNAMAKGSNSISIGGGNIASNSFSVAMGVLTTSSGQASTSTGQQTMASGDASFATGYLTNASGSVATAVGYQTIASGVVGTAIGYRSVASGSVSTAIGDSAVASGYRSFSAGFYTKATGDYSFALGNNTRAQGYNSFAVGSTNIASGETSTALGFLTTASGRLSTAMGDSSVASAMHSTAMGYHTIASNNVATSMGYYTTASGSVSVAMGSFTKAKTDNSLAIGIYNDTTNTNRVFEIGNGTADNDRKNAMTVLQNGNIGIGTIDPRFTLSFNTNSGDKISLYDDGNPAQLHFGFGISSGQLLQIHSATPGDDIAFGYGNSVSFTEQMRIKGNGKVGIGTSSPFARLHVADSSVVFTAALILPASPGNTPVSGAGTRMMWYPEKAAFRVGAVNGTQWDKDFIGNYSFAAGIDHIATGLFSNAVGAGNTASGDYTFASGTGTRATGLLATAMGSSTTASGAVSTAMGDNTIASGWFSTVMGRYNKARSDFSLVTGIYNDTTATNRLFEIGNGTADNARNNALTVLMNGTTLITGPATLPGTPANTPATGNGYRMMWYADKASFRVGQAIADSWDKDNIGVASFATGSATKASGITSFAAGNFSYAVGDGSVSAGYSVQAKALGAASFGIFNDITDSPNASTGAATDRIFQVGNGATNLTRTNALTILRNGSVGFGSISPTKQMDIVGGPSAQPVTLLIGNKGGFGPAAIEFISDYGAGNQWRPGYIRSNDGGTYTGMLEFYTNGSGAGSLNGNMKGLEVRNGITYTSTGTVSSWSDSRLKKNIQPFNHGLDIISKINTVSFYYNELAPFNTDKQQIGVIAQELEKIAPFMVDKAGTSTLEDARSVNNQAYVFLLINAVKELDAKNKQQQTRIDKLEKQIEQLIKK